MDARASQLRTAMDCHGNPNRVHCLLLFIPANFHYLWLSNQRLPYHAIVQADDLHLQKTNSKRKGQHWSVENHLPSDDVPGPDSKYSNHSLYQLSAERLDGRFGQVSDQARYPKSSVFQVPDFDPFRAHHFDPCFPIDPQHRNSAQMAESYL